MANTSSTSSRKPRSAARATSRPAATRRKAAEVDEKEISPVEAQEIEAEGHYITATLCGEEVQVVPPTLWRASWQRLLQQGLIDAFAEKVFHPDDFELYVELDPTMQEWAEFTEEAARMAGESQGNSRGPAASSRRTPRR
ncbi:hypothetical protein ABTZ58_09870 [Streptomyces sp. NPDC094143]|uniref:hypothetical protein n=1 Tax=unclassified Streptomyces TaxID=2593676 RepID=UPI003319FB39